ncbi:Imm26 family immunity protein [Pseudomonas alliivorans]
MNGLKIYGWEKKPKTLLRNIKSGDIFCFCANDGYRFGRIMTKNSLGHVAEIFAQLSESPDVLNLSSEERVGHPVILDSYGLFDRKIEGDWRIIAHQENYIPSKDGSFFFTYGVGAGCKKIDIFDNELPVAEIDAKKLPDYSLLGERDVIKELGL